MLTTLPALLSAVTQSQTYLGSSNTLLKGTQCSLNIANELIAIGKNSPEQLLALAYLSLNESNDVPLSLRMAALTTFIGLQAQHNDHYLQHGVAAAYCTMQLAAHTNAYRKQCLSVWSDKNLGIFVSVGRLSRLTDTSLPARYLASKGLNTEQCNFIVALSLLSASTSGVYQTLQQLTPFAPISYRKRLVALLDFPGQWLPGSHVQTAKGKAVFVQRYSDSQCVIWQKEEFVDIAQNKLNKSTQGAIGLIEWLELESQSPVSQSLLAKLIPPSFPISRPPSQLTSVIQQLHDSNIDISKLAQNVENTAMFADYLKSTASQDNRLQLPVRDVKQAILTYGLERVSDMLVLRALTQRLQQKRFPLLTHCNCLSDLAAAIAAHLATVANTSLTPQTAALLSIFLTAPLYNLPRLKTLHRWPRSSGPQYNINTLVLSKQTPLLQMSGTLMKQWQQPAKYQAIVAHTVQPIAKIPRSIRAEAALLGLSLLLARQWLYGVDEDEATTTFRQAATQQLQLSSASFADLQSQVAEFLWLPLTH